MNKELNYMSIRTIDGEYDGDTWKRLNDGTWIENKKNGFWLGDDSNCYELKIIETSDVIIEVAYVVEKTTPEVGGVYFFINSFHGEQFQVLELFDEIDYTADVFETGGITYFEAVKVLFLTGETAGQVAILSRDVLKKALPVPMDKIERYSDDNGKEFAVVFGDSVEGVTVSGGYIELDTEVWLHSMKDGRYVDYSREHFYTETFFKKGDDYEFTGKYIRTFVNRSFKNWFKKEGE